MSELERQFQSIRDPLIQTHRTTNSRAMVVDVVCDDRQVQLTVEGHNTVGQIRQQAITEMGIMTHDADKYVVIGSNRQPISDQRTVDEIIKEGQALSFRLIPQVAFGPAELEVFYA